MIQYYKPEGNDSFFGDAMPFYDGKNFHLFYLLDHGHHSENNRKGGHQWAHLLSGDLMEWKEAPIAVSWKNMEGVASICTGSVFLWEGVYYAFYSIREFENSRESLAVSKSFDGIDFQRDLSVVFPDVEEYEEFGYEINDFRDPLVFENGGTFHMLVSAKLRERDGVLEPYNGCLAHLVSKDLMKWEFEKSFIVPGYRWVPECSDLFEWNGWHYLLFSHRGVTHYKMSKNAFGPWKKPEVDVLTTSFERVMKTASFKNGRRIGAAFIPTVENENLKYAGRAALRELVQKDDGTLGTKFPDEWKIEKNLLFEKSQLSIDAMETLKSAFLTDTPSECRIAMEIKPRPGAYEFGLLLKGSEYIDGVELRFCLREKRIELRNPRVHSITSGLINYIQAAENLEDDFKLELVLKEDIIDLCINNVQCMLTSCPGRAGNRLFVFAQNSDVSFESIKILSF